MQERLPQLHARVREFAGPYLSGAAKAEAVRCYETQIYLLPTWGRVIEPGIEDVTDAVGRATDVIKVLAVAQSRHDVELVQAGPAPEGELLP